MRGCMTRWRVNGGAPANSGIPGSRSASGGATSGIGSSATSGALHGTENAASASAISAPSCSMRADSVLSERPARSIVVRDARPGPAAARARSGSSASAARASASATASISARSSIAAR